MTAPLAVDIQVDFDENTWLLIPDPQIMDAASWAHRNASAWTRDLGRENEANWGSLLERMLARTAHNIDPGKWDFRLVHMRTPPREAPYPMAVCLKVFPSEELVPAPFEDVVADLVGADNPALIEPPTVEWVTLPAGIPAVVVVQFTRGPDADDEAALTMLVIWRLAEDFDLVLYAFNYDIGRVLGMREDLLALAAAVRAQPAPDEPL